MLNDRSLLVVPMSVPVDVVFNEDPLKRRVERRRLSTEYTRIVGRCLVGSRTVGLLRRG